ncbi:hypothetical protein GCM10022277_21890 [Litoribacillus peritrichatus]|uniref:Uncharacterized protein n=1 Tax=Litoribacillus peritrichatus TaxID=718191 RepID=A0ABP7MKU9_9GAMM
MFFRKGYFAIEFRRLYVRKQTLIFVFEHIFAMKNVFMMIYEQNIAEFRVVGVSR